MRLSRNPTSVGLATSFLTASASEFSLVRRHPSETMFGIQLAGNKPSTMVPAAEVIGREFGDAGGIDFVDINCGCPIDLVFKSGSGSACELPGMLSLRNETKPLQYWTHQQNLAKSSPGCPGRWARFP